MTKIDTDEPGEREQHGESRDGELSETQEKAISALLSCVTVEAAAKKVGVSDRTLHRWLKEPGFRRAHLAARRQVMDQALGALQQGALGAVAALVRNLSCGQPSAEVSAARIILDTGMKGVDMLEFEDRLSAFEEWLAGEQRRMAEGPRRSGDAQEPAADPH